MQSNIPTDNSLCSYYDNNSSYQLQQPYQQQQRQQYANSNSIKQSHQQYFNQQQQQQQQHHQQQHYHQPHHHNYQPYQQQSSQYQYLIYQNKIQILNDRLQCYIQQVQNLKRTNSILLNKLSTIQLIDQQLEQQKNKNDELKQQIEVYREQIQDDRLSYQTQIEQLKHQLEQKDQFIELIRDEHEKINTKKDQQINYLKDTLKQKINKLQSYQKKLHTLEIERLNTEQDSQYDKESFLIMKNSQISRIKTFNSQNVNSMNLQKSTVSVQQKAKMFMKRDPSELKIMVKSLTHAQKCLEIGGQQLSMIGYEKEQQKSMLNASRLTKSKINKTYCK